MSKYTDFIGSASQIDEIVFFNDSANIVTLDDDRVYLRGGVFEDDLTVYPDAYNRFKYLIENFSVRSEDTGPIDIAWDGTYFWVIGFTTAYKYNASGVYEGVSFTRESGKPPNMSGITFDGTSLWVVGTAHDKAYKYSVSGAYEGVSFDVSQDSRNSGITWDGTNLWVIGYIGDKVYKHIPAVGIESDTSFGGQNYVRVK